MVFDDENSFSSAKSIKSISHSSKKIKKPNCSDTESSGFTHGEKILDQGDYFIIRRLNQNTKRMNQVLQCKLCPLKFPKLCNLRDHLRIHNSDMPFRCNLCGKKFTQAGNRDRHEKGGICAKKRESITSDYNS